MLIFCFFDSARDTCQVKGETPSLTELESRLMKVCIIIKLSDIIHLKHLFHSFLVT